MFQINSRPTDIVPLFKAHYNSLRRLELMANCCGLQCPSPTPHLEMHQRENSHWRVWESSPNMEISREAENSKAPQSHISAERVARRQVHVGALSLQVSTPAFVCLYSECQVSGQDVVLGKRSAKIWGPNLGPFSEIKDDSVQRYPSRKNSQKKKADNSKNFPSWAAYSSKINSKQKKKL